MARCIRRRPPRISVACPTRRISQANIAAPCRCIRGSATALGGKKYVGQKAGSVSRSRAAKKIAERRWILVVRPAAPRPASIGAITSEDISVLEREADLDGDLPMRDLALHDVAASLQDLEPLD